MVKWELGKSRGGLRREEIREEFSCSGLLLRPFGVLFFFFLSHFADVCVCVCECECECERVHLISAMHSAPLDALSHFYSYFVASPRSTIGPLPPPPPVYPFRSTLRVIHVVVVVVVLFSCSPLGTGGRSRWPGHVRTNQDQGAAHQFEAAARTGTGTGTGHRAANGTNRPVHCPSHLQTMDNGEYGGGKRRNFPIRVILYHIFRAYEQKYKNITDRRSTI